MRRFLRITVAITICRVVIGVLASCETKFVKSLADIETYVESAPDSALASLAQIDTSTFSSEKQRALYNYLVSLARYKTYCNETDEAPISRSIDYFRKHRDETRIYKALYLKGYILLNAQDYNRAIETLSEAEKLAVAKNDLFFSGLSAREMSQVFAETYSDQESLECIGRARKYFEDGGYPYHSRYALLSEGLAFDYNGQSKQADSCYTMAISISIEQADTLLLAQATLQKAIHLTTKEMGSEAIPLFLYVKDSLSYPLSCQSYMFLARAYAQVGSIQQYRHYQTLAQAYNNGHNDEYVIHYQGYLADLSLGDHEAALKNILAVIEQVTSEQFLKRKESALRAQRNYYRDQEIISELERQLHLKQSQLSITVSGVVICVLLVLFWLTVKNYKKKSVLARKEKEVLVQQINTLASKKSGELKKSAQSGMRVFNALTQLYWQNQPQKIVPELERVLEGLVSDKQIIGQFITTLNETRNNIVVRLAEQCPKLTPAEIYLFTYLASQMKHNTICTILDKSPSALNAQIYRLRKKIEDSDSIDKEEFLDAIS